VADGIGHGQHRQPKASETPRKADAELRNPAPGGAAAAAEGEPERAEQLGRKARDMSIFVSLAGLVDHSGMPVFPAPKNMTG